MPVGMLHCNCYVLWEDPTAALVIDPGDEGPRIVHELKKRGVTPKLIVNTHGHFDHTGGVDPVRHAFHATYRIHAAEGEVMRQIPPGTRMWGQIIAEPPKPDGPLVHEERLDVGGLKVRAIHTPGHTPGSTCFYVEADGSVFTGDTLFFRSIGRSDFPGGNHDDLLRSIRQRLLTLDGATRVYPGHGPASTVAQEADENPFLV